jgi:hypothetical protein
MAARDLHPQDGARYLLERERGGDDDRDAIYRASVYLPAAIRVEPMTTTLVLSEDGSVAFTVGAAAIDEPHNKSLLTFAKLTARAAPNRRQDGLPTWPQRVLRWRK